MQAVYMTPQSTFPATFPSNTLFGAICRAMDQLGEDVGALITTYADKPPFLISSCFPYLDAKKPVTLYPLPILPLPDITEISFDMIKSLKKVRWVDGDIFHKLCTGTLDLGKLVREWDKFRYYPRLGLLTLVDRKKEPFREVDIPHNQINRLSSASEQFYHTTGTHYENSGLWFLVDFYDSSWEKAVRASLRLLADQGIGQRRSVGQGSFSLSFGECAIPAGKDAPYLTTLSRFVPDSLSSFGGKIWYDIVTVRGRTQDGFAKKQVLMVSESSSFKNLGKPWYGRITRVRENPPMVEYGFAFPIGLGCLR